jgi:hypothetical protein
MRDSVELEVFKNLYHSMAEEKGAAFAPHVLECAATTPVPSAEDRSSEKVVDGQDKKRAALIAMIDNRLERISAFTSLAKEREKLVLDAEG